MVVHQATWNPHCLPIDWYDSKCTSWQFDIVDTQKRFSLWKNDSSYKCTYIYIWSWWVYLRLYIYAHMKLQRCTYPSTKALHQFQEKIKFQTFQITYVYTQNRNSNTQLPCYWYIYIYLSIYTYYNTYYQGCTILFAVFVVWPAGIPSEDLLEARGKLMELLSKLRSQHRYCHSRASGGVMWMEAPIGSMGLVHLPTWKP